MRNEKLAQLCKYFESGTFVLALLTVLSGVVAPITASAQGKKDEITFDLVANPKFVDCLRESASEVPRARATVIRGKLNDTLISETYGVSLPLNFYVASQKRLQTTHSTLNR